MSVESNKKTASQKATPSLTNQALTLSLVAMCTIPVILIFVLLDYMPRVYEGELEASIGAEGLPPGSFYDQRNDLRPAVPTGDLIVRNESDQDWTHLNIRINDGHYQIYDVKSIPAGEERKFKLDRFLTRSGARFDLRYNPLKNVLIYARRPTKDRATFETDFDWKSVTK